MALCYVETSLLRNKLEGVCFVEASWFKMRSYKGVFSMTKTLKGSPCVTWVLLWIGHSVGQKSSLELTWKKQLCFFCFATVGTRRPSCDVITGLGSALGGEKAGEI